MCPSFFNQTISLSTLSCRLIDTRRPFCFTGFSFSKNSALTLAIRIFSILVNKFGYSLQKYVCNSWYLSSSWLPQLELLPLESSNHRVLFLYWHHHIIIRYRRHWIVLPVSLLIHPGHLIFRCIVYNMCALMVLIFVPHQSYSSLSSPLVSSSSNTPTYAFKVPYFSTRFTPNYFCRTNCDMVQCKIRCVAIITPMVITSLTAWPWCISSASPRARPLKYPCFLLIILTGSCFMVICGADEAGFPV